jgi:hypothetical protein
LTRQKHHQTRKSFNRWSTRLILSEYLYLICLRENSAVHTFVEAQGRLEMYMGRRAAKSFRVASNNI